MASQTIKLKSYVDVQIERKAAEALYPGYLIELNSNDKVQAHANAGQSVLSMFAIENALEGEEISTEINSDDWVRCWTPIRGDEVNAVLADGEDVSIGDKLESAGDGTLQKFTADTINSSVVDTTVYSNQVVGIALEAKNLSSSGNESSGNVGVPVGSAGIGRRLKVLVL